MATYLIADPHFFHASPDKPDGIIRMCNRPFANGREMNEAMASAWRSVVRHQTDEVIVVGDFAHRADPADLRKLFESLPGRKYLVKGNHDGPDTLALGWAGISDIAFVSIDSTRCVLCHYALRTWPGIRKSPGAIQLYGHSHGRLPGNSQSMDVGVDVMGFAPVRLAAIKSRLAQLPPLVDPEGDDFDGDVPKPL